MRRGYTAAKSGQKFAGKPRWQAQQKRTEPRFFMPGADARFARKPEE
jgi:hypothetical protein